jgi:hypothetical protein
MTTKRKAIAVWILFNPNVKSSIIKPRDAFIDPNI